MATVKLETLTEYQKRTKKEWPDSLQCARGNVKRELKAAFPKVKFSIRTSRFSGGNDLTVEWTDGPTKKQVDEIINQYSGGSFDGMIDLYEYNTGDARSFTNTYGSAKYVSSTRNHSREALQKAADEVAKKWNVEVPEVKISDYDGHAYISDEGLNVSTHDQTWDSYWMARQVINRTVSEQVSA